MAHYVFQRNNGFGDFDYIRNFETMEITDYKEFAAQVDDRYLAYIDIPYLNQLGFFAIGITQLALRIEPLLLFMPRVRGFRPAVLPRAARLRGAAPGPRPTSGPMPAPRGVIVTRRVTAPRPAPVQRTAPRPAPLRAPRPTVGRPAPAPAQRGRIPAGPGMPPPPDGKKGRR